MTSVTALGRLSDRWARENPASAAHAERARRVLSGGVTHDIRRGEPFPLAVRRAAGSRKWDADGHELVCYVMGHGALLLGHDPPEVIEAVQQQAPVFLLPGACHELEVEWAEAVTSLLPAAETVRFTSSGTEATLLALRLARAGTGRPRIVKLAGHFHGWHDQVSYGIDPPFVGPDSAGLPPSLAPDVVVASPRLDELEALLSRGDVAGLILEPSGAAWGTVPFPDGFLDAVRRLTTETGTILIFDEVVTGFRWSPGGVQARVGVAPDLTTLGKILAGGMPGGAVAGTAAAMAPLGPGGRGERVSHPGTHNANPVSAAAGVAMLSEASTGIPHERADRVASILRTELTAVFSDLGIPGSAYGESSTFHLLVGSDDVSAVEAGVLKEAGLGPEEAAELDHGMLLGGVHLFHGSGFVSNAHGDDDVERTVAALRATLSSIVSPRV